MADDSLKTVQERLQELPKDVQDAILANDFEERIAQIGKANRLHIDQIGELGDEVMLVMLGFVPSEELTQRLQKTLHLYDEQAEAITRAINNDIFLPIRGSMQKFQETQRKGGAPATPASAPAATRSASAADMMLSQKTVSIPQQKSATSAPTPPVAPTIGNTYKTDPYREPVE